MRTSQDEDPDSNNAGSSSQEQYLDSAKNTADDPETAPLLIGSSIQFQRTRRHTNDTLGSAFDLHTDDISTRFRESWRVYHSSDESLFFDIIMEKVKSTKIAYFVDKLAVESEPGLTNAQLMLNNHDLKPVEPERRQWGPWNFVGFWVADSFNIVSFLSSAQVDEVLTDISEHMDDFFFDDRCIRQFGWSFLVAVMVVCLAWIHHRRLLRLPYRKNRSNLPHLFPRYFQGQFWNLGCSVARFQSRSNGLHLVRGSSLDWGRMCSTHDLCNCKWNSGIGQNETFANQSVTIVAQLS
jgi:hypothetical protein